MVDKYNLMRYIKLSHAVVGATWNEEEGLWHVRVRTPDGTEIEDTCNVLVNGGGVLKSVAPRTFLLGLTLHQF